MARRRGEPATQGRRVLITGAAGELAGQLAARLEADERVEYLVGVDLVEPAHDLDRTEFVRADLRNPLVAKVIDSTRVDTIVHLSIFTAPLRAGGRARMKELNVIGTMQLLAAAGKAPQLRKLVLKSTTAVYGSNYADPALFREDATVGGSGRSGYSKDAVEIEGYGRAFGRRRPDVSLTLLRFANFLGPRVETPLTRYFALPVVPTVLGYDPRLQFCHEDDATEILYRSVVDDRPGIFNVAGPGILYLSQAIRLAGKVPVPVPMPFADGVSNTLRRAGRVDFSPEQLQFLRYGRVGDIGRMRATFDYEPKYSTRESFIDFIGSRRIAALIDRDRAMRWERDLYDFLTRKGQERFLAEKQP
jgi:UDP-glucose 4-epimerase